MFRVKPLLIMIIFCGFLLTQALASWSTPQIITKDKDAFITSMHQCIDRIYYNQPESRHFPKELIIAQAILESSWGTSRFANEANNLFGIRTWNENTPHVKPVSHHNEWHGWGVKAYQYKCDSVRDVVRILNDLHYYESLREERDKGSDATILAYHLESFSTNPNYGDLINDIIRSEF